MLRPEPGVGTPPDCGARHLVCISSINWDEVWEGPQEIMSRFAAEGWGVLFVESIGGRPPRFNREDARRILDRLRKLTLASSSAVLPPSGLTVHTPWVFPPSRMGVVRWMNRRLLLRGLERRLRDLGWERPILWTYNPSAVVLEVSRALHPRLLVYCCIHDYAKISDRHAYLAQDEAEMIRAADLVLVLSRQLLEAKRELNPNIHLLPQGANLRDYLGSVDRPVTATELEECRHPIIGYIGTIHEWVDQDLLCFAARARPNWRFVFIGPEKASSGELRSLPNVVFLGPRPHHRLPDYVRQFDVGIIPYVTTGFAQTIRPNKVLEYMVMGKPVVTTNLPELREFDPYVLVALSRGQFLESLEIAVRSDSAEDQARRRQFAVEHSMDHSFPGLQQLLLSALG